MAAAIVPGTRYEYRVDGSVAREYQGPITVTGTGVHRVTIEGSDGTAGAADVRIDDAAPSITAEAPATGASYVWGAVVAERYRCDDSGSGITSCSDTNAGGTVNTSRVGPQEFTIRAEDAAGHVTSLRIPYTVTPAYRFQALSPHAAFPGLNKSNAGDTVPIKFELFDAAGRELSDLRVISSTVSQRIGCAAPGDTSQWTGAVTTARSNPAVRHDATGGYFIFNWQTDRTWGGTCRRFTLVTQDGVAHNLAFEFLKK